MKRRKRRGLKWAFSMLLGFICALVLGALFYGTMAYQLAGGDGGQAQSLPAGEMAILALPAELTHEQTYEAEYGGALCRIVERTYRLENGGQASALSASPAAYLERLSREGWTPKLVTGFTLAGLDAVLEEKDGELLLAAIGGDAAYIIKAGSDEQTLYALGAQAALE